MVTLVNRAKMSTSTSGTGTITLGSASSGYQSFADAGVADGDVVRYVIEDGTAWEVGYGTYTASGTTLSRTVMESSNSDNAINLSGSATVFVGAAAEDVPNGTAATSVTPSGSTYTLNLAENTVFHIPAATTVNTATVALSNIPSTASYAGRFQFSYGYGTVTWPSSFEWENKVAPTLEYGSDYVAKFSINNTDNTKLKATIDGPFAFTGGPLSPQFVGYVSATGTNTLVDLDLTALTGGAGSTALENDVVVVCGVISDLVIPSMTTSGYTTATSGSANDTEDTALIVAYKVMGATPDTQARVNFTGGGAGDASAAIAFVFRGVDTTTPLDVTPTISQVTNTVLADPPSITTATGGKGAILMGIGGGGHANGVQTYSDTAGDYTTFFSIGSNSTNDATLGVGYALAVSDGTTYNPSAFTFSGSDNVAYSNVAVSLILRGTI